MSSPEPTPPPAASRSPEVVALAGGVGAGKFLRGLDRVARTDGVRITVVVNTGDDLRMHGLQVCPDLDSVCYWLAGLMDRDRGWGRADETFHTIEAMRDAGVDAWFSLGDRDLGTHLRRTELLRGGATLSEATRVIARGFGVVPQVLPMTDDEVTTRIDVLDPEADGGTRDLHFQEYWVRRRAADPVKHIRYTGAARAVPHPAAIEALGRAEAILVCPSNPVASIAPILAVPGYRQALATRRAIVVGISPIVAGAPLAGMADRLMPAAGLEVSALGAARAYEGLLGCWILDERDRELAGRIEHELEVRTAVTDTIMVDDGRAEALARVALSLARERG